MIISIDPGLHACGVALWDHDSGNHLLWAGLVKRDDTANNRRGMVQAVENKLNMLCGERRDMHWPDKLVIEVPQVYVRTRSKGDPNDLIQLALVVGAFDYWFQGFVFMYKPHDWKGSTPKDITEARARKRLSPDELMKIEKAPKSLMHNTMDAVALGLHYLKREPLVPEA